MVLVSKDGEIFTVSFSTIFLHFGEGFYFWLESFGNALYDGQ